MLKHSAALRTFIVLPFRETDAIPIVVVRRFGAREIAPEEQKVESEWTF